MRNQGVDDEDGRGRGFGTLLDYIDFLIGAERIKIAETAIGLYVFGKPITEMGQMETSILRMERAQCLRIATDEALALFRPVSVRVGATAQI